SSGASSGSSGATTTWAKAVWRRWAASKGDSRTSRCTPRSALSRTYAVFERPVRVRAADGHRRRLEAGLLAGARLDHVPLEAAVRGPALVHAQEHLRPVLCVGPARPGVDLEQRVSGVVLAGEERVLLQPLELPL